MSSGAEKVEKKTSRSTGGRPSRAEASRLREKIIKAAAFLFFSNGYGSTSIESIAKRAGISKRTFYHRFSDKAEVFKAVVYHVVEELRPPETEHLFEGTNLEQILLQIARALLSTVLRPQALALYRLILSEATRFPELALIAHGQGSRNEAITRIAGLLESRIRSHPTPPLSFIFAAEQFFQMVTALPQRRALGLGSSLSNIELDQWAQQTVKLFLCGIGDQLTS